MGRKNKRGAPSERKSSLDLNFPRWRRALLHVVKQREPKRKRRGNRGLSTKKWVILDVKICSSYRDDAYNFFPFFACFFFLFLLNRHSRGGGAGRELHREKSLRKGRAFFSSHIVERLLGRQIFLLNGSDRVGRKYNRSGLGLERTDCGVGQSVFL